METTLLTRRKRRAWRLRTLEVAREARVVTRMAGLDYKVSGENGALRVTSHAVTRHLVKRPNSSTPPPGRGWDRSGPVKVVVPRQRVDFNLELHDHWGRQVGEQETSDTTE